MKQVMKFLFGPRMSVEDKYLANSTDLVDLEHRQRRIQRGQAPFQSYL